MTSCCCASRHGATDVSSLSNCDVVTTTHIDLDWTIDFAAQTVSGHATLLLEPVKGAADVITEVHLDAKGLAVSGIEIATEGPTGPFVAVPWTSSPKATASLGSGLAFTLPVPASRCWARCAYSTKQDECLALCWLEPDQTESGNLPFLYSQCQAIHARTMLPCQDSPGVRATYTAKVRTASPSAVTVLMSALAQERAGVDFVFNQPVAIPSYLIAIAAGNIASIDVSPRCRVYAEPTSVKRAAEEFSDMELFLSTAESIAGPYEWQRYDVIVMPPSFPFGGMENPNLTFVTPTVITGDKSLVELIAHEICHSWSGNLVGISSWEHFWINEGFTTFLQRKITDKLHGKDVSDFESGTGYAHLAADVDRYGATHAYTALVPPLAGEDPDDAFSSVPYEKGFAFLQRLEALVGADSFIAWIKNQYIPRFRTKAINSDDVRVCFSESFPEAAASIDWGKAYSEPGMPPKPTLSTAVRDEANAVADDIIDFDRRYADGLADIADEATETMFANAGVVAAKWQGRQHVAFLERVQEQLQTAKDPEPDHLGVKTLAKIDSTFGYNAFVNNEALALWFAVCLRSRGGYVGHMGRFKHFMSTVGRMKFVRPLYRAWAAFDAVAARQHFDSVKRRYHAITAKMTQQDFDALPPPKL